MHSQVPNILLNGEVSQVAIPPMDLQRVIGDARAQFRRNLFGHGSIECAVGIALIEHLCCLPHQYSRSDEVCRHICEFELQVLKVSQLLAELFPRQHVLACSFQAKGGTPKAATRNIYPASVQCLHRDLEPQPLLPNQLFGRHPYIVECDQCSGLYGPSHLLLLLPVPDPHCIPLHNECRHLTGTGLGHYDVETAETASGNEHLAPIQYIVIAFPLGTGLHGFGVGATVWFGEAVAGKVLHGDEFGQILLPLLCGSELIDDPRAHVVDGEVGRGGHTACGQGFEYDRGIQAGQSSTRFAVDR